MKEIRVAWVSGVATTALLLGSLPAFALDPNVGLDTPASYRGLPDNVVPKRYYGGAARYQAPVTYVPAPISAPPAQIMSTPVAPAAQPALPPIKLVPPASTAPVAPPSNMIPPPPILYPVEGSLRTPAPTQAPVALAMNEPTANAEAMDALAPAAAPYPAYNAPMYSAPASWVPAANVRPKNQFSLGIIGFYDEYQEDSIGLTDKGVFGGITANYTHYFNPRWYGELGAEAAYGATDYESTSGNINGIDQWSVENRVIAGFDRAYPDNTHLKTYAGLSTRYFSDELKGKTTQFGAQGYDRRIFQVFLPIGMTYEFASAGWNFAPNIEFAPLLWGNVSSRLGTLPGYPYVKNRQTTGYHLRGEFMMSQLDARGRGWQLGPFVRYWDIPDSDVDNGFIEPENTRLQLGAKLAYLF